MEGYIPTLWIISPEPDRICGLLEPLEGIDVVSSRPGEQKIYPAARGIWADVSEEMFTLPPRDPLQVLILSHDPSISLEEKQQLLALGSDLLLSSPVDAADAEMAVRMVKRYCDELVLPREVAETMGQGLTISSREGTLLYTNEAFARMIGRKPEEIQGSHVKTFVASDYRPLIDHQIALRRSQVGACYEVDLIKQDERRRVPALVTAAALKHQSGSVAVITDLSRVKHTEHTLRERERELAAMVDNIPGFFYRCRFDDDWTMLFITKGCREITGYSPEDLLENRDISYGKMICPEDRGRIKETWNRAIKSRSLFEAEYRIADKNHRYRWVWERGRGIFDDAGALQFLEGFITDITKRKYMERELRFSEERYRSLVETFHDGIVLADDDGRIMFANSQAHGLSGTPSLIGMSLLQLVPGDERASLEAAIDEVRTHGELHNREFTARKRGGATFPVEVNVTRLADDREHAPKYLIVARDITERKIAQEEHRLLQKQLSESQRIESLGRLAGGIAHDYNNMLGVIIGYTELMMESVSPEDLQHQYLGEILTASHRSAELTRQLLALSGQQHAELKECSINDLLERRKDWFARQLGENMTLDIQCGESLPSVQVDQKLLEQVLLHLLSNAREASQDQKGRVVISTRGEGDHIVLQVEDFGCGMDQQQKSRVFDPFYTTKSGALHVGLGLPVVHGIVRQHGGFVKLDSTLGAGTAVTMILPAVDRGDR